ncbi:MAG: glutamate mutase L [Ktedonobacterales bacterium]
MPPTRSLLMVDCGTAFTKVALLGRVEGHYRLLARAQAATTLTPPVADVTVGMRHAIASLEHITGRVLLQDGTVLSPRRDDGAGVDGVALATSVGGPLHLLATGPGRDALAGLLHRAIGGLFVQLDALPPPPRRDATPAEWHALVAQLRGLHPHAVLIIGSPFGAARSQGTLEETIAATATWLDALREPASDAESRATTLPVIFSGNAEDAATLATSLQTHTAGVQPVEALSPSTLAPVNRAVSALYESSVLRDLPAFPRLRTMATTPPAATITALAGMVRYLAQHFQTSVVGVDPGASSTALVGATAQGEYLPASHPNAGVGPGAGYILRAAGMQSVLRWMSSAASEDELHEYVLTRMLRPHALPASPRELEFEHALAREAISLALRAPGSRLSGMHPIDVVLGTGGVLANVPHPAMAALLLLDAIQPRGITSLVLDTAHLANMVGSVAGLDQAAAAEVAAGDAVLLQLGTVISTVGTAQDGEPAVRVVLEMGDGRRHVEDVAHGSIACLPLPPGERATLGLYPGQTIDVGLGAGQHARASEPVEGGALGLIVDARGRPLALPPTPGERIERMAQWRRTCGLEV